jgi:hypothetical protein
MNYWMSLGILAEPRAAECGPFALGWMAKSASDGVLGGIDKHDATSEELSVTSSRRRASSR